MKQGWIKKLLPHFIALIVFLIIALFYCRPVLQGDVLQQPDIVQWTAMSKSSFDYKEKHGHFPLWTNNMFSGMPAYQIAMESDNPVSPGIFYTVFTFGLPKPVSFFFLACICFYFLTQVLRVNPYVGMIGALTFAYATYNAVIVAEGHDTKMQSIAMMPALIGSLILIYDRRYLWGAALTALFTALLIAMNHMQIVYYSLLIAAFMTIGYVVRWIMNREFRHLAVALALAAVAGLIGLLSNAVNIFTTYDYSKATIRGGSELADSTSNSTKTGLDVNYALDYSVYKMEPFTLMVPKIYGGSSKLEVKEEDSKAIEQLQQMPNELAQRLQYSLGAYWGGIGGTSGPHYAGAIICFLALIGFFILDNKHKWWILATLVMTILMSWGSYFLGFNSFLLKHLPMYDKFRAPSVILVVPVFLLTMMAMLTLQKVLVYENKEELWNRYKKGLLLTGGVFVVLLMFYLGADFRGESDKSVTALVTQVPEQMRDQVLNYTGNFLNALHEDRKALLMSSLTRSFLFIAAAAFMVWLSIRKRTSNWIVLSVIGLLAFIDVMGISSQYLNSENYKASVEFEGNFTPTEADKQILKDTSYYRVFDLRNGFQTLTYGAKTAYFHRSIGGYHPAKLSIYQDLIEHQLQQFPQSMPVVDMLNTKYIIQSDQSGRESVYPNTGALGPAWFVKAVRFEPTARDVMNALTGFNAKDTAIVFEKDKSLVTAGATDSSSQIRLLYNDNDEAAYQSTSSAGGFAVFSEIFYDKGWKAYIDGKESPIIRTNYVLRGLSVPAGQHNIHFVFHPDSYYNGQKIAIVAGILIFLLLIAAIIQTWRTKRDHGSRIVIEKKKVTKA